jgi:hypothetical protein
MRAPLALRATASWTLRRVGEHAGKDPRATRGAERALEREAPCRIHSALRAATMPPAVLLTDHAGAVQRETTWLGEFFDAARSGSLPRGTIRLFSIDSKRGPGEPRMKCTRRTISRPFGGMSGEEGVA